MKICKVKFTNINSLAGTWTIDFENEAFRQSNIFAIVGATGTGKSSILDAICLALYARTPRQKSVSQTVNELMTKNRGYCESEVLFETHKGRYIARFYQNRGHKNPTKPLQTAVREIRAENDPSTLLTKVRDVEAKVEEVTGLSFESFTRCMLLSQGKFAEFILAKDDEKANILESLTGTSIYRELSIAAYERKKEEEEKLNKIVEKLGDVILLTDQEKQNLEKEKDELEKKYQKLQKLQQELVEQKTLLEQKEKNVEDLKFAEEERKNLEHEMTIFAPRKEKWERGNKAEKIWIHYVLHNESKLTLEQNSRDQLNIGQQWEKASCELEASKKKLVKIKNRQETLNRNQKQIAAFIQKKVIPLDEKRSHQKILWEQAKKLQAEEKIRKDNSEKELNNKEKSVQCRRFEYENNMAQYEQYKAFEPYENKINTWDGTRQLWRKTLDELDELWRKKKTLDLDSLIEKYNKVSQQFELMQCDYQEKKENYERQNEQYLLMLQKKSLDSLTSFEQKLDQEREDADLFDNWIKRQDEYEKCLKDLEQLLQEEQNTVKNVSENVQLLSEIKTKVAAKKEVYELKKTLLSQDEQLTQLRKKLHEGDCCPLCGAHVQEASFVQVMTVTSEDFEKTEQEYKCLENECLERQNQCRNAEVILESLKEKIEDKKADIHSLKETENDEKNLWAASIPYPSNRMEGEKALKKVKIRLEEDKKWYQQVRKEEKILENLRELYFIKKDEYGEMDKANLKAYTDLSHCQKEVDNYDLQISKLKKTISSYEYQFSVALEEIGSLYSSSKYSHNELSFEHFCAFISAILENVKLSHQFQEKCNTCQHQLSIEECDFSSYKKIDEDIQKSYKIKEEECYLSFCQLKETEKERLHLLSGKTISHVEARMQDVSSLLSQVVMDIQNGYDRSLRSLDRLNQEKTRLVKVFEEEKEKEKNLKAQLEKVCFREGFTTIEDVVSAHMTKSDFEALDDEMTKLKERGNKLEEKLRVLREQRCSLETRLAGKATDSIKLQTVCEEINAELSDVGEQRGRISAKIEADCTHRKNNDKLCRDKMAQEQELVRWEKLSALIGSATGSNFSRFAQGITFEIMVNYANLQLRRLSDRYQLRWNRGSEKTDKGPSLGLNIVDSYQGDEVRPCSNLSGGETFLVSLALALGLSKMTGKQISVDTLFLDEGFGTLDAESLEKALDTLDLLQEEGKLIGVISHVDALKERMATRLELSRKQNSDSSLLVGPGVTHNAI